MIIERDIGPFLVLASESLSVALDKITANKSGFVVCINEHGALEGVLTDGDFRRWMIRKQEFKADIPVGTICNRVVTTALVDSPAKDVAVLFSDKVDFVPLLDRSGKVRAIAREGAAELWIGSRVIAEDSPS